MLGNFRKYPITCKGKKAVLFAYDWTTEVTLIANLWGNYPCKVQLSL